MLNHHACWVLAKVMDVEIEQEDVDAIEMLNAGPLADNAKEVFPLSTILVKFKAIQQ